MSTEQIDPAKIMAEHGRLHWCSSDHWQYETHNGQPCLPYRLAEALARVTVVLDEAYREDVGLSVWREHPELQLRERHEAWLDEEERAGR